MPGAPDESDDNAGGQRTEPGLQSRLPESAPAQLFGKKRAKNDEVQTAQPRKRWQKHPVRGRCPAVKCGEPLCHQKQNDGPNQRKRVPHDRDAPDSHLARNGANSTRSRIESCDQERCQGRGTGCYKHARHYERQQARGARNLGKIYPLKQQGQCPEQGQRKEQPDPSSDLATAPGDVSCRRRIHAALSVCVAEGTSFHPDAPRID